MSSIHPSRIYLTLGANTYKAIDPKPIAAYLTKMGLPVPFQGKANSYKVSRDGSPGVGWLLLRRDTLTAIDRTSNSFSITFTTERPLPGISSTVTISNLHISNALAVTGTTNTRASDVYMVEFRDKLDYAKLTSLNKGYNLRTDDWVATSTYFTSSTNGGTAWTWATMIADIWTNISPLAGALTSTLAVLPTTTPDNFALFGTKALSALQNIVKPINHSLICKRDGSFHLVADGDIDTVNAALVQSNKTNALAPANPFESSKTTVPEKVRVYFPKRHTDFQSSTDNNVQTGTDRFHTDPTYSVLVPATDVIAELTNTITGAEEAIWDSLPAIYDELGSLQNGAALTTRAEERAELYYHAQEQVRTRDLFAGPVAFEIGPLFDGVHWYDFGQGIRTETIFSQREVGAKGDNVEWPGLPDLSRYHLPYSRLAVAKIYNEAIPADGSGLVRILFGTRTSSTVTTWAETTLPHEVRAFNVSDGAYLVNKKVIIGFHRQTSRWIIISGSVSIAYAKAQLNGNCCGTSTATVDNFALLAGSWTGTAPTTVYNPMGHAGLNNEWVRLIYNEVDSQWEIIDATHKATQIIVDIQVNDSDQQLEYKRRTIYAEWCDTDPEWEDFYTGSECT